jgi:hypothetical protein
MEKIVNIISIIKAKATDEEFILRHKSDAKAFIRKREISFSDVIYFVLSLLKTTLPFEIMHYFGTMGKKTVNPSNISRARSKCQYTAFLELFLLTAKAISVNKANLFKGYRVLAFDGMQGELQNTQELRDNYPPAKGAGYPKFHAVAMYDVLNDIYANALFLPAPTDERAAAIALMSQLDTDTKDLILADRGFPSLALLQAFSNDSKKFVMRVKSNFLREVSDFTINSSEGDKVLHIDYSKRRGDTHKVKNAVLPYSFDLRCVKFILPDGEVETLITNLENSFTKEDIIHLYGLRWGIETSFNHLKNAVRVEDFVGVKDNSIKQEFFASLLFYNLNTLFVDCAGKQVKKNC